MRRKDVNTIYHLCTFLLPINHAFLFQLGNNASYVYLVLVLMHVAHLDHHIFTQCYLFLQSFRKFIYFWTSYRKLWIYLFDA